MASHLFLFLPGSIQQGIERLSDYLEQVVNGVEVSSKELRDELLESLPHVRGGSIQQGIERARRPPPRVPD